MDRIGNPEVPRRVGDPRMGGWVGGGPLPDISCRRFIGGWAMAVGAKYWDGFASLPSGVGVPLVLRLVFVCWVSGAWVFGSLGTVCRVRGVGYFGVWVSGVGYLGVCVLGVGWVFDIGYWALGGVGFWVFEC